MRVLVEQTYEEAVRWLDRLGMLAGAAEWDLALGKRGLKQYHPQPEVDKLDPCPSNERQARGVWDSDTVPASKLPDETGQDMEAPEVTLSLDPMELGLSVRYGPSWRERMQGLLERLGPFLRLAYLEALLRVADWRASRREDEKARKPG